MKQSQFEHIKSQVYQKIELLYNVLRQVPNIDAEALGLSKKIVNNSPFINQKERIRYTVNDIIIRIPVENAKRFSKTAICDINDVELHISMDGEVNANLWGEEDKNPWQSLSFKAELKICTMGGELLLKSFHVDQIPVSDSDYKEVHPLSHVHFCEGVEGNNACMREDLPRLIHYPLDIVLGLSVALQNYAPQLFDSLCRNSNYLGLCYESQKRLLVPYFSSYADCINNDGKSDDNIKTQCPYLV